MIANIIVLAGQSNAVGVGLCEYLPQHFSAEKVEEYKKGYENILINAISHNTATGGFVPVKAGLSHLPLGKFFGPEVSIAEALNEKACEEKYFIVKYAVGSVGLCDAWRPPSSKKNYQADSTAKGLDIEHCLRTGQTPPDGWCYNDFVSLLKESIATLESKGYTPKIKGFCWMQGENDSCSDDSTEEYEFNFKNLICDFKQEFSYYCENLKIADAGISTVWERYEQINNTKRELSKELNTVYIDTVAEGLHTLNEPKDEPDIYHYDSDSVIKLGRMFADAILS